MRLESCTTVLDDIGSSGETLRVSCTVYRAGKSAVGMNWPQRHKQPTSGLPSPTSSFPGSVVSTNSCLDNLISCAVREVLCEPGTMIPRISVKRVNFNSARNLDAHTETVDWYRRKRSPSAATWGCHGTVP